VSDEYIRLIPTEPYWQPTLEAASAAVEFVGWLFAGPGDAVELVRYEYYDHVTLIDAGGYTTEITCPRCGQDIREWFWDLIVQRRLDFDELGVRVPCCRAAVRLDEINCDSPVGFAKFEVSAMNATRGQYELNGEELRHVAALLGHPVTQILARY
jgi:hypothetical protein